MGRWWLAVAVGAATLGVPAAASATWSVVGVDPETGEVGVAVASCVPAPSGTEALPQVVAVVPGVGALAAQGLLDPQLRDEAAQLIADGTAPQAAIDMVVANDVMAHQRQYGAVSLDGRTGSFTGDSAMEWAGSQEGENVSVQGNYLRRQAVVQEASTTFAGSASDALGARLLEALETGSARGGDNRCSEAQTALAATLIVAKADDQSDEPSVEITIASQQLGGRNPVELLRDEYEESAGGGCGCRSASMPPPWILALVPYFRRRRPARASKNHAGE